MRIASNGLPFALFLGMLAALPPLSIDMALPALVPVAAALRTTPSMAGLTLGLFMIGFAVSPIVYGPAADRFGRRPVLLVGLGLFTLGGVAATGAMSITMLLGARLLQGAGAGVGMTLAFAIVRDVFEGKAARTRLALITVVANVAPIVAPAIGATLLAAAGWRAIYGVTTLSGLALIAIVRLGFAETRPHRAVVDGPALPRLVRDYRTVLMHGETISHILVNGLGFGWMFAYVAGSPLILVGLFRVTPAVYALLFACTGAGIMAGAAVNGYLARHGVTSERVLLSAILLAVLATATLTGLTIVHRLPLSGLMPLLVLATFSFGLAAPSASHGALDPMPAFAGVTGGLLTSVQMLVGAAASSAVALLFADFGLLSMVGVMTICALGALGVYLPHVLRRHRHAS
ncbi:MAG TPA: multidrug effflux MFS transporter [Stellaceae bacterium]|nr:multidrug effflux MFS transporter [Stellaceae bacterium]